LYDPEHNGSLDGGQPGDGTGLGTIGNWRTAGGIGSAFALRTGNPDWLLLRMGDTWIGQTIETGWSATFGSDNFGKSGYSQQEPMVIAGYDENFSVAAYGANVGGRQRPIIQPPSASSAYTAAQTAGTHHFYEGRPAIGQAGSGGSSFAVLGLHVYAAQRDPGNMTAPPAGFVGNGNTGQPGGIAFGTAHGDLIEDNRISWTAQGLGWNVGNFDVNVRRNQIDHCWHTTGKSSGIAADDIGASGSGYMANGFSFEENIIDLCGWIGSNFASGDPFSRDAYIQWDAHAGNRRGNTITRSSAENAEMRGGGIIDDNFFYNGQFGVDIGHFEGQPTLTSPTTQVTNNVIMSPVSPIGLIPVGVNFINNTGLTASGNILAHADSSISSGQAQFAVTDSYDGRTAFMNITGRGSGGTQGYWPCVGQANFTGGHGTVVSNYTIHVSAGGAIDDPSLIFDDDLATGAQTFEVGDVLTPVANYPSINKAGTTLTAAGSGGTAGNYGMSFIGCRLDPSNNAQGVGEGVALTNFSGSMAGSGALASVTLNDFTGITRALNGGTGFYDATGTVPNGTNNFIDPLGNNPNNSGLSTFTTIITVYGVTPSAYNGTWATTASVGNDITWSLNTAMDPGPVTVPGHIMAYQIMNTGVAYQVGDVLTIASGDVGGQSGIRIRVDSISALTGWQFTVNSVYTDGTQGLTWTGNTVFNWAGQNPPQFSDCGPPNGGTGGCGGTNPPGGGTSNTWTGNTNCVTAQFTGQISSGTSLATSSVVNGPIASSTNLAGPGVMANTTIVSGSGSSWTISPSQGNVGPETMYSYTCTPTKVWSDPSRTIATYAALHGQAASIDGYMVKALANSKNAPWDPTWTANLGLNPYIRLGFQ
jgi:hypothetical protein